MDRVTDGTFGLETSRQGEAAILRVSGQLDLGGIDELRQAAFEACEGAQELVVDVCELVFIDSTGLAGLVELRHAVVAKGVEFRLRAAEDGPVRTAVELTGIDDLLIA